RAAVLLVELLADSGASALSVLLDRPVGNSGRTRALLEEVCSAYRVRAQVLLSDTVDRDLVACGAVVATSDSWILDHAGHWVDLPSCLLARRVEPAFVVDFTACSHSAE
ncbi:MAG: hypothetical protein JWN04_6566, partial [Myxococcaceae bacterium]|nr:hypothetical protein [Myxococcaceae bacterium]